MAEAVATPQNWKLTTGEEVVVQVELNAARFGSELRDVAAIGFEAEEAKVKSMIEAREHLTHPKRVPLGLERFGDWRSPEPQTVPGHVLGLLADRPPRRPTFRPGHYEIIIPVIS